MLETMGLAVLITGLAFPALAQTAPAAAPVADTAATPTPATPAAPPAEREFMYSGEATSILGRQVRDPAANPVGRIVDILVDDAGQPRAAVIEFGGFMGIGNRKVAVAWRALHFTAAQPGGQNGGRSTIGLDMTADQIKDTPEWKRVVTPTDPPVAVAVPPPPTPTPATPTPAATPATPAAPAPAAPAAK